MIDIERHINYFQTAADKQTAIDNDQLNYPNLSYVEETGVVDLAETAPPVDYSKKYFTIVSLEDNNAITWNRKTTLLYVTNVSASTDNGETWTEKNVGGTSNSIATLNTGDKLLLKGTLSPNSGDGIGRIAATGQFTVEGNSMSLLFGDDFSGQTSLSGKAYAFENLFSGCTGLTSAENLVLPATTLVNYCYSAMFRGCSSLTSAPVLPATALATYCYGGMFSGCTSLTTAPDLPATSVGYGSYQTMFNGCRSLTTAPALPATTMAELCYNNMFNGCTGLTTAPELPATTLAKNCYSYMFRYCTSLNYIKMLATDISASDCLKNWVDGVASGGTFVKKSGVSIPSGVNGIPNNWTVQEV